MPTSEPSRKPAVRRRRKWRGQSMVEYSVVTWVLMVGLMLGTTVKIVPQGRQRKNLIELFLEAYQAYYDSVFFMLNLPFP